MASNAFYIIFKILIRVIIYNSFITSSINHSSYC